MSVPSDAAAPSIFVLVSLSAFNIPVAVATCSSAEYLLPYVSRYLIDMEDYKYLTLQYNVVSGANTTSYLKMFLR
jgi:hypothetical protein